MTMGGEFIWVDDIDMFVVRDGHGTTLVTVHGGPGLGHAYLEPLGVLASQELEVIH